MGRGLELPDVREFVDGRTVAIVGNAESIDDRADGEEIDGHDVVVRLNNGIPTPEGWRFASRGRKMDVWAGSPVSRYPRRSDGSILSNRLSLGSVWDRLVEQAWVIPWNRVFDPAPPLRQKMYVVEQWKAANRELAHRVPSGFGVAYFVLSALSPGRVTLYGFDWWDTPSWPSGERGNQSDNKKRLQQEWLRTQDVEVRGWQL